MHVTAPQAVDGRILLPCTRFVTVVWRIECQNYAAYRVRCGVSIEPCVGSEREISFVAGRCSFCSDRDNIVSPVTRTSRSSDAYFWRRIAWECFAGHPSRLSTMVVRDIDSQQRPWPGQTMVTFPAVAVSSQPEYFVVEIPCIPMSYRRSEDFIIGPAPKSATSACDNGVISLQ